MSNKVPFFEKKVVDIRCPSWCRHPVGRSGGIFQSASELQMECPPSGASTCESCRCLHWRAGAAMGEYFLLRHQSAKTRFLYPFTFTETGFFPLICFGSSDPRHEECRMTSRLLLTGKSRVSFPITKNQDYHIHKKMHAFSVYRTKKNREWARNPAFSQTGRLSLQFRL